MHFDKDIRMGKGQFKIPPCPANAAGDLSFAASSPWLAPLAGYSDLSFRLLCREYGAAVCVTEMISARGLYYKSEASADLLKSVAEDQPLVVQLFGGEAEIMAEAVRMLRRAGYRWFDCNLGCSVRKMMRQNAGASLLADPQHVVEIARAMVAAARETSIDGNTAHVGFKLRAGVNSDKPVLPDLALRLEDAGASWIAVHPRYASEGFKGRAHWEMLASLARRLGIPLIASGDLLEAEDGIACISEYGATGVMYARGAMRNPAIFARHATLCAGLRPLEMDAANLRKMIDRHLALARLYCQPRKALLKMRSIVPRYTRLLPGVNDLRKALCECVDWEDLPAILDKHLGS